MFTRKAATKPAITFSNALEQSFETPERLRPNELELVSKIDELDLRDVTARAAKENKWSAADAAAYELQYRQFLFLNGATGKAISPFSKEMDEVWHNHVLFTQKYQMDCANLFGRFLHHSPNTVATSEADKIETHNRTSILFQKYDFKVTAPNRWASIKAKVLGASRPQSRLSISFRDCCSAGGDAGP